MIGPVIEPFFAKEAGTGFVACRIVGNMLAGLYKCMGSASSGTEDKNIHFFSTVQWYKSFIAGLFFCGNLNLIIRLAIFKVFLKPVRPGSKVHGLA